MLNKNGAASQEVTHSAVAVYGLIIPRRVKKAIDKSDDSAQTLSRNFGTTELGMTFEEEETI